MKSKIRGCFEKIGYTVSKPKIYSLIVILFFGVIIANAQSTTHYYYYKGKKIPLTLDKRSVTVSAFNHFNSSLKNLNAKKNDLRGENTNEVIRYSAIEYQMTLTDAEYNRNLNTLENSKNIRTVSPNFIAQGGIKIGMSDYFYVRLKKPNDLEKLKQLAKEKNVQIIKQNRFMPLWYTLRCTEHTTGNTLEVANYFFETGLFLSSSPDFLEDNSDFSNPNNNLNFKQSRETDMDIDPDPDPDPEEPEPCSNDPDFNKLWGLRNNDNPSVDINACEAWEITEGEGVTVAVFDTGIELTHSDLADNISSISYDSESDSSPSMVFTEHGTRMAGIIGAIKDNNLQVVGVAPQSTLISVSNSFSGTVDSRMKRADGINWAWQNGADIINNSWLSSIKFDVIDEAINNALTQGRNGKGTVLVFSSGNQGGIIGYPPNSNADILCVGSIEKNGLKSSFSNHGPELDVVAPGKNILTTSTDNGTATNTGTSYSAAFVSGVAALILSANPCLTVHQVNDIIEKTAQKVRSETYSYITHTNRPNGTWNNQTGYGLVDAYAAAKKAKQMKPPVDLYIKDSRRDLGVEPNMVTNKFWRSSDIWTRNNPDGIAKHQTPVYSPNHPRYIYVRVRRIDNGSCLPYTAKLAVYWTKAGTGLSWPKSWDGTLYNNGVSMGAPVGTLDIPLLEPGEETILEFPWQMPNPNDYHNINPQPWHFCFLARILSEDDPMTVEETRWMSSNTRNNNNIAWKNISVTYTSSKRRKSITEPGNKSFGGVISVGNPFDETKTFSLEFVKEDTETGKAIFDEAEVSLSMDQTLYNAWKRGGEQSNLLSNTNDEKKKIVTDNHATLDKLRFTPNESGTLNVTFNFLTKEMTDKSEFVYHVIQKDTETGEVVGGETYVINKDSRPLFTADAGEDQFISENESVTLSAKQLEEVAVYNWYDTDRKLIHQGKDLTVSPEIAKKYKLEVIALDGFKDYDEVEVKIKSESIGDNYLDKIIPNPASNTARFTYHLGRAKSAYLMVVGFYHGATRTSNNYILDRNSIETTIDLTNYSNGYYQVALVCDGKIIGVKTLIKE